MTNKDSHAAEFALLWEELGDKHNDMPEDLLISKEQRLFDLKAELSVHDVPYILDHTSHSRMLRHKLLEFLK